MSKRYIFFIGTLCNGGAERVVSILSSRMAEQGMDVEILTYYNTSTFYDMHPKVQIASVEKLAGRTNKFLNILWLRKYFKEHAKVVISFLAPFNMIAIAAKMGTGVPIIVADRNDPTKVPGNVIVRKFRDFLYVFAEGIVVQTEKNKNYFSKIVRSKCVVIYNPINLGKYAGAALDAKKEKRIVTAGRLMPQKNQKMLIRAFAKVLESHPDYELVIYGDGPSRKELENTVEKLGIREHVFLPGNTADLHELIQHADIFVLSSDYEGMPNALIEAMCMGLPVVSTKVSGATDLIQNGVNGLLIEVGVERELTEAIEKLLMNCALKKEIATEAAKISEKLMLDEILKQWVEIVRR